MPTIGTIKGLISAYLGETASNFTVGGIDLRMLALNNARKSAELAHNFVEQDTVARLAVGASGGAISSAVLESDGATAVSVKAIKQLYLRDTSSGSTVYVPLFFDPKKTLATRILDMQTANGVDDSFLRYRDDNVYHIGQDFLRAYQLGSTVYLNPTPTSNYSLAMDVSKWMSEYTQDADIDWMTTHGYTYLMWAGICECNKLAKTFAFRQEGYISPPEKERDTALQALILWDEFRNEHTMEGLR